MQKLVLAAILAAVPASSFAAPVTLEFTGTIIGYEVDGVDVTSTLSHLNASGTITWDLAVGPAPTFVTDSATFYQYIRESGPSPYIEFVQSSVQWANGTFTSAAVPPPVPPGANATGDQFVLSNNVGANDLLIIGDLYQWDAADGSFGINGVGLNTSANFLADASGLPSGTELPDFATGFTVIGIFDMIENALGQRTGFAAGILVDSARLRPAVPEPSTLALLGVGLGTAALVRRRKTAAKGAAG